MSSSPLLFPDACPEARPVEHFPGASPTQQAQIRRGLHPLGRALPGPDGETCGTCAGRRNVNPNPYGRAIYQCEQAVIGVSCRVRVRWPACVRWRSVEAARAEAEAERAARAS